ncbi:MAG: hypothetical protein NWQ93_00340, partial [bacterium Ellin6529]|nr:hypothetical protein [bacterium Ellin6529]
MADRRSVAPLELARRAPRRFATLSALPFLRLRETFRGRRGPLAFLAVVGPGLIAGVAGNDAGGITTYA